MYGASQLARSPPPRPRPPAGASPPPPGPPALGRMPTDCPVRRSRRCTLPFCDVAYVMSGSDGIAAGREAVAAAAPVPVARADADAVLRAMRAAHRAVVLRPAADVVERQHVVDRHAVELRDGQAREVPPRLAFVPRLVEAAVVAEHDVVAVAGVRPDDVVIDVHPLQRERPPGLAAVLAPFEVRAHRPHGVGTDRIHEELVVVARIGVHEPVAGALPVRPPAAPVPDRFPQARLRRRRDRVPGARLPTRAHVAPASSDR